MREIIVTFCRDLLSLFTQCDKINPQKWYVIFLKSLQCVALYAEWVNRENTKANTGQVRKGCGTLMTSLYKDYALKLGHLSFELTFPNLKQGQWHLVGSKF